MKEVNKSEDKNMRNKWGRFKFWFKDPFITKVDIYERTRIEHRAIPYKLKVTALPLSAQERLDQGGVVQFEKGRHHLTETLTVTQPRTTIIGAHLQSQGVTCLMIPMHALDCGVTNCDFETEEDNFE